MKKGMKKIIVIIALVLVVALCTTIAVIKDNDKTDTPSATEITNPNGTETENNTDGTDSESPDNSADTLSDKEIKELFVGANEVYVGWLCSSANIEANWDNIISLDDSGYYYSEVTSCKFSTVQEIEKELQRYFSEEAYKNELNSMYKMKDGKLYANYNLCEGGDAVSYGEKLVVASKTPSRCEFSIAPVYEDGENLVYDYESSIINTIELIDGQWKFCGKFHYSYTVFWKEIVNWVD